MAASDSAIPATGAPSAATDVLVCYAVKEEAGPMVRALGVPLLVTGMGVKNAERSIRHALTLRKPGLVLTCGFAGGLNPVLKLGDIVYSADPEIQLQEAMQQFGACAARFRTTPQVIVQAEEKLLLRQLTGNDAVEMESAPIRAVCRREGIPSATIRVILDTAEKDLPVDFNAFLTSRQTLNYAKLIWAIVKHPGLIKGLRELQRESAIARTRLDEVLVHLLRSRG
jgi:nucleoside phosphorylase